MATYQFEGASARYRLLGTKLMLIAGTGLGPLTFAPPPPAPGRGPYLELTELGDNVAGRQRPLISPLPAGITLGPSGLRISEPAAGFEGSSRFIPFEDSDLAPEPGVFAADNGAITARFLTPVDLPDPTNTALLGIFDTVTGEYLGIGWIGDGTTGSAPKLGFVLQLATGGTPDPPVIFAHSTLPTSGDAGRWVTVRWRVASSGQFYIEGEHHPILLPPSSASQLVNISGGIAYRNIAYDRWREFIQSSNLRVGLIMHINSIRSAGADAVYHEIDRFRVGF